MIADGHRLALAGATAVFALLAVMVPAIPIGPLVGVQAGLASVALVCFVLAAFDGPGLSLGLLCVVGEIAVAAKESDVGSLLLPLAGACALAAAEGTRLCAIWSGRGVRIWSAERLHVIAGARRAATAAAGATIVSAIGTLDPPRAVVLICGGVVAAGVAIWLVVQPSR